MKRLALVLILTTGLSGCASKLGQIDAARWGRIQVGMTREQVISQLGPPRTTFAQQNVEVMDYVEDRGILVTKGTGIFKHYYVQLKDGKVDAYGPEDSVSLVGVKPVGDTQRPDIERIRKKYERYNTAELQLRRQQLAEAIPDTVIKFGIFGPDFTKERQEKEEVESELLRRFQSGDVTAELKPLPKNNPKLRGGNF